MDEIQALINELLQDDGQPTKSFQQLLKENPNHAGGLAHLAAAERDAQLRTGMGTPMPEAEFQALLARPSLHPGARGRHDGLMDGSS